MRTVKLLSWHAEIAAKAKALKRTGVAIDAHPLKRTSRVVGELAESNPAALVLDMDRLPSNCREIALMLRSSKSARHIPILFAGSLPADDTKSLPEKYARLKAELPDIPYATWADAGEALVRLLRNPQAKAPLVPPVRVYTSSLAQKLGIVAASGKREAQRRTTALVGAPDGFVRLLGELPETARIVVNILPEVQLAVYFVRSTGETAAALEVLSHQLPKGASAWIAYSKKGRGRIGEFTENDVRTLGLNAGWVDYKIASLDADWSGMKFARKKAQADL